MNASDTAARIRAVIPGLPGGADEWAAEVVRRPAESAADEVYVLRKRELVATPVSLAPLWEAFPDEAPLPDADGTGVSIRGLTGWNAAYWREDNASGFSRPAWFTEDIL